MKFCFKRKDGGSKSTVTGFWLIEWKSVFSIVLLRFDAGSREAYHNHAFNALTWWISGEVVEHLLNGESIRWTPSFKPKLTPRNCFHKVYGIKTTYALSLRGPWQRTWKEYLPNGTFVTLTNGRKIISTQTKETV